MNSAPSAKLPSNPSSNNKPDLRLIVFDMGGVFIRFEWEVVCQGFADAAGVTVESFRETLSQVNKPYYEKGQITTIELINRLNKALALELTEKDFARLWNATLDEDLQMAELLQELRQRFPLYLLSNINDYHFRHIEDNFNVSRHFEELILSHEVGYVKPEPEIYHEVLKRSKLDPQHCLFIDDLVPNVQGAKEVGLHAIHFTGIDNLRSRLTEFGIHTGNHLGVQS